MGKNYKNQDLQIDTEHLQKKKTVVIPIMIGAHGTIPKRLPQYVKLLKLSYPSPQFYKKETPKPATLLGTTYIPRYYLNNFWVLGQNLNYYIPINFRLRICQLHIHNNNMLNQSGSFYSLGFFVHYFSLVKNYMKLCLYDLAIC